VCDVTVVLLDVNNGSVMHHSGVSVSICPSGGYIIWRNMVAAADLAPE